MQGIPMVANRPEIAASFADASNEQPRPATKSNNVKSVVKDYKTMSSENKGKINFTKSIIKLFPEVKVHGTHAQPYIGENTKMQYLTSLFPEKTEYTLSESEITFLELMAHKHNVDINDLYELFMEGVDYWETVPDETRSAEEYGYYFVNEAVQELEEKRRWFDFRDDEQKSRDAERKHINTEYMRKVKYQSGVQRNLPGYRPSITADPESKGKPVFRYRITIKEKPNDPEGKTGEYKVRAENPLEAIEKAYQYHEAFGGKGRNPEWEHELHDDMTPVGATGGKIASRKNRRVKKPKTLPGKLAHWRGQVELEKSTAPRAKKRRGDNFNSGKRRRRRAKPEAQQPLPPSRQIEFNPEPYDND